MNPPQSDQDQQSAEASSSKAQLTDEDGDVQMEIAPTAKPAPTQRKQAELSDSTMMFGRQHDVAECMDNCIFQIETALLRFDGVPDSADKTSVVKRLFFGKIRQRLTGAETQQSRASIHEKEDLFSHLPVNVANDGIDIYDGLSKYFDDVVEYEGGKTRMEISIVDLPPILQIQLQRVQFNRDTQQPYKSQAYVKFTENLYMDRFMDDADPVKKSRSKAIQSELTTCRDRVRLLVEDKDSPYASFLEHTRKFLTDASLSGVDEDVVKQLSEEQDSIRLEVDTLRIRIDQLKNELEILWRDCTEAAYELTSVFIHRGSSPSWGHYFFYSRHLPGSPDSWFKYNDSDVTVVSKDEVLADTTGSTANPYLLVFARRGSDVVDTVKRFDPPMITSP
jgi:ubiquitin carboxyl-terminal hydrolase 25/28